MTAAGEQFAARVPARGSGLRAAQLVRGLAARTVALQGQRTRRTRAAVTHEVARVVAAPQPLAANLAALVLGARARARLLRLAAGAGADACLAARRTRALVTRLLTRVGAAVEGAAARGAAGPLAGGAAPHGGRGLAAVAGRGHGLGAGRAGAGVAQQQALVATPPSPAPAQRPAADLAAAVRSVPGVELGVANLAAEADVVPGYPGRGVAMATLGAGPQDLFLFRHSVRVILQLHLLLIDGIFSPLLYAVDVETIEAV